MRQAQARKSTNAYLDAPRRSERHLRVVDDAPQRAEDAPRFADAPDFADDPRFADAPRSHSPAVAVPDWAEPFADPRWDDRIGEPDYEERDGRRTVLVTGRPEGKAVPRREATSTQSARIRRQSPTRARLAGRPDRVALWAVALGLLMAAMAGFSGNGGHAHGSQSATPDTAPALSSR